LGSLAQLGVAFCGVPRLQRRQACGPGGIPEPGLAGRRLADENEISPGLEMPPTSFRPLQL